MFKRRLALTFLPLALAMITPASAGNEVNTIESIRTASTPEPKVEIEISSTKPFPVRDQIVILRIGTKDFYLSRPPSDGSLNTLIFMLTPDEFAQLDNGDQIVVQYGQGDSEDDRRYYGILDKNLLDQAPPHPD
jgi:hypothetical protein